MDSDLSGLYPSMSKPSGAAPASTRAPTDLSGLYPTMPPETATAPAAGLEPKPMSESDLADELYGDPKLTPQETKLLDAINEGIPEDIAAERKADPLRGLYDPAGNFADTINERTLFAEPIPELGELSAPARSAVVREVANMAQDLGLTSQDVRQLQSALRHPDEPSESERAAWRQESYRRLTEMFGKDADRVLEDARKLVAADPRRARILEQRGAGDRPEVVLLLAEKARQARIAGRLK